MQSLEICVCLRFFDGEKSLKKKTRRENFENNYRVVPII